MRDDKKKGQLIRLDHRALRKRKGGHETVEEAAVIVKLAGVQKKLEKFAEAEKLLRRSLAIQERLLAPDDPVVGLTAFELGDLFELSNRLTEAEEWFKRSLAIRAHWRGEDPLHYVETGWRLALVAHERGNSKEAEDILRRLLAYLEGLPAPEPEQKEQLRLVLQSLGKVLAATARPEEALAIHRKALANLEQDGLVEDVGYFDGLCFMAETHFLMEQFDDAEQYYLRALELGEILFGPDDPEYLEILESLQDVYETLWRRLNPSR